MTIKYSLNEVNSMLYKVGYKPIAEYNGVNKKHSFICPYCDNIFETTVHKVITRHTKSCGCVAIGRRKGTKYISGDFFDRLKRGAKSRNLSIEIDIQYLEDLLIQQNFRCALSNIELTYGYGPLENITASVDRIDVSKGYVKGNLQWVHKDINWMKQDYTNEEFISYCRMVANAQKTD